MPTNTLTKTGVASDPTAWSLGTVPVGGEDVVIGNTYVLTMDMARFPVTGALNSLSATGTGSIAINMSTQAVEIAALTITGGTIGAAGFIGTTGATNALTLTTTTLTGGSANNSFGVFHNSTGALIVTGQAKGGSSTACHGIQNNTTGAVTVGSALGGTGLNSRGVSNVSTGTVTISGAVTGGSQTATYGFYNTAAAAVAITGPITGGAGIESVGCYNKVNGVVTLAAGCNLINGTGGVAYNGYPPVWAVPATGYHQYAAGKLALEVAAGNLKLGITNGTVTGTLAASANGMFGASP